MSTATERADAMSLKPCRYVLSTPSTTANLGPGFDCLGLALKQRNRWSVVVREGEPGRRRVIRQTGGETTEELPRDENHYFFAAWNMLFRMGFGPDLSAQLVQAGLEVELEAECATPIARGLGSSAALLVASCEAYRRLTGVVERAAWELASQLEGHPDNAGPAGLGGLFVGTRDEQNRFRALQPAIHPCWSVVVAVPNFSLHTAHARAVLPPSLSREDGVFNLGRLPFLLEGLRTGDHDHLTLGCQDRWHQNQRATLIPGYHQVLEAATGSGASAVFLSGAGPTMAAFVDTRRGASVARGVSESMVRAFASAGVGAQGVELEVDSVGLEVEVGVAH